MGIISRLFGTAPNKEAQQPEHAVLVKIPLSNSEFGLDQERSQIQELTDQMDAAINEAGVGEFDGDEFGDGICTLYMYGPDADRLLAVIDSILRSDEIFRGAKVTKRYGQASDPKAREEHIEY